MPERQYDQIILAAKIEAAYGTDAAPTGADAIFALNAKIGQGQGEYKERNVAQPYLGNKPQIKSGLHNTIEFEVELAGSGAAGTAPAYGPLLRACGFAETIVVATDVTYLPVSGNFESVTIYAEQDGDLHKFIGARGDVSFDFPGNDLPKMKFKFTGLWSPVAGGAIAAPDFSAYQEPLEVNFDNTPAFTLHGYSAVLKSLEMGMSWNPTLRDLPGAKKIRISERTPGGSIQFEAPDVATKDFFAIDKGSLTGALLLTHGAVAGNIIELSCPKAEFRDADYADDENILMISGNVRPLPDTGDDDVKLVVK